MKQRQCCNLPAITVQNKFQSRTTRLQVYPEPVGRSLRKSASYVNQLKISVKFMTFTINRVNYVKEKDLCAEKREDEKGHIRPP
jgi:hypothetical protein